MAAYVFYRIYSPSLAFSVGFGKDRGFFNHFCHIIKDRSALSSPAGKRTFRFGCAFLHSTCFIVFLPNTIHQRSFVFFRTSPPYYWKHHFFWTDKKYRYNKLTISWFLSFSVTNPFKAVIKYTLWHHLRNLFFLVKLNWNYWLITFIMIQFIQIKILYYFLS